MAHAESRHELLSWVNSLLKLNYTKVEQLGTGAAYAQIFDALWGDIPMYKIRFDARHEYEFVSHFKVIQFAFACHKVEKSIPVEQLVKCRFQDNIKFLQWVKKFYDSCASPEKNKPYDAVARRHSFQMRPGTPVSGTNSTLSPSAFTPSPTTMSPRSPTLSSPRSPSTQRKPNFKNLRSTTPGSPASTAAAATQKSVAAATSGGFQQAKFEETILLQLRCLEKERNFYFNKLREIEMLIQAEQERTPHEQQLDPKLRMIQKILYSTEEGFVIPDSAHREHENAKSENGAELLRSHSRSCSPSYTSSRLDPSAANSSQASPTGSKNAAADTSASLNTLLSTFGEA